MPKSTPSSRLKTSTKLCLLSCLPWPSTCHDPSLRLVVIAARVFDSFEIHDQHPIISCDSRLDSYFLPFLPFKCIDMTALEISTWGITNVYKWRVWRYRGLQVVVSGSHPHPQPYHTTTPIFHTRSCFCYLRQGLSSFFLPLIAVCTCFIITLSSFNHWNITHHGLWRSLSSTRAQVLCLDHFLSAGLACPLPSPCVALHCYVQLSIHLSFRQPTLTMHARIDKMTKIVVQFSLCFDYDSSYVIMFSTAYFTINSIFKAKFFLDSLLPALLSDRHVPGLHSPLTRENLIEELVVIKKIPKKSQWL